MNPEGPVTWPRKPLSDARHLSRTWRARQSRADRVVFSRQPNSLCEAGRQEGPGISLGLNNSI